MAPGTTTVADGATTSGPVPDTGREYVLVGGDWGRDELGPAALGLVGLHPDGVTWLGEIPPSLASVQSDLAGGIVFQPGATTGDWSIYWIPAGSADPRVVVDLAGRDVGGHFRIVSWNDSPAVLYSIDTVVSGGVVGECEECDDEEHPCGDCGVFVGEMRRIVRLQSLRDQSTLDVLDTVIELDLVPRDWTSVDDYAAGRFEITRMDAAGCGWVEFWDESGRRLDFPTAPTLLDVECDGEPRMGAGGDLSLDGSLIIRLEPGPEGGTDLVVRRMADGGELHRIAYFRQPSLGPPDVAALGHAYDGRDTMVVLYGTVPDDGFAAADVELVRYGWAATGELSTTPLPVPPELVERVRRVEGGCCSVTFLADLEVPLSGLDLGG